ncbi:hypothetical protein EIL87_15320 [Saccharopolyspora rhizosphaerae]|uniref:DUF2269 domain-containing protein n=1 Tax=Saccharopolyspora rhizosphaerae TaxID=2492662 RepID=A0A426JQF4_9PSEU|nr:hypothetical protein [Saccharopolyspora rhizosphaerae]RRO15433.1 hypothetical protein EIL87_15320 [Saccharopolyspora rhizosphaerae]
MTATQQTQQTRTFRLPARARRAVLLLHVVAGVGWFGIAAVTFVLTLAMLTRSDSAVVRAGYEFHELLIASLARPASLITLGTGLVLSTGTKWGIAQHYWPLVKLVLTVATIAITASLAPGWIATAARLSSGSVDSAQVNLVGMAAFHLLTVGAATWLSIYKPGGRTRWAARTRSPSVQGRR